MSVHKSWLKENIREIMAIVVVGGGLSYMFFALIIWWLTGKEAPNVAAIFAMIGGVIGFYFTSSPGSEAKTAILAETAKQGAMAAVTKAVLPTMTKKAINTASSEG